VCVFVDFFFGFGGGEIPHQSVALIIGARGKESLF